MCNEGNSRRGRRAGVLLAPHTYYFFTTRTQYSGLDSELETRLLPEADHAKLSKMSKPQIILNAGCAAIAMAIALAEAMAMAGSLAMALVLSHSLGPLPWPLTWPGL